MIIEQQNKDIFSFPQNYILINTVNCVGVMGKGLALQFKNRFPQMFKDYQIACKKGDVQIGKCWYWKNLYADIINFPTKNHWKYPSKYEYIAKGLDSLIDLVLSHKIENCVIPKLGCANGGLDYTKVKSIIYQKLQDVNCNFVLV